MVHNMSDLDRTMEALRNADAAGNIEDAQKLAIIADRLRRQKKSDPQKDKLGAFPFAAESIAKTLGAPVDLANWITDKIPGKGVLSDKGLAPWGSEEIKQGMGAVGIKLPEEGREPETIPEHIGAVTGEVASYLIPGAVGTKMIAKTTGIAGGIAKSIWSSMVKHPYLTMASEITGGVGAGIGRGVGEQEFPDSPGKRGATELIGGVVGSLSPALAIKTPTAILINKGKSIVRKISLPFTEQGAKYRAGNFLKSQVTDPTKISEEIGEQTIAELPPVIQSGEKRLVGLYKTLLKTDPLADSEAVETLSKSIISLEKEMRKLGYGSPELLAEITQKRIASIELKIDKRIMDATQKATDKLESLPIAQRKNSESIIVRNEIESALEKAKVENRQLWNIVPKDFEVGFDKTRQSFISIMDDLADAQKVDIPLVLKKSPIINNENLQFTSLKEMQGLRSKLLETARKARKDGQWNKARIAENVSDAILDDLGISAGGATTPEALSLQTALASTKQMKTRFESGVVGKILGYSKSGAPAIDPSLTLDISIGRMGTKGAVDIDKIVITPEAKKATQRYLARSYTDYATDPKTGNINNIKAERWTKNNEAILDQFPELRDQLKDIEGAQKLANSTRKAMDIRKQAIKDPNISISAKFLNSADMNKEVITILKSKDSIRMANELSRQARKDPTGAALNGLRGGFIDHILEKSAIGSYNELGEQTLSGSSLLNFMNKNKHVLFEIFDSSQIQRMKMIGRELAKIERYEKINPGKVDIEMKDVASSALKLFSRVGGAQIGRWVAKMTGGGTVQTPGIFSERFKTFATFLSKDRAFQMLHDAILSKDPKLLQALLLPIDKPGSKMTEKTFRILDERMNLWLAGSGKRIIDDIMDEEK